MPGDIIVEQRCCRRDRTSCWFPRAIWPPGQGGPDRHPYRDSRLPFPGQRHRGPKFRVRANLRQIPTGCTVAEPETDASLKLRFILIPSTSGSPASRLMTPGVAFNTKPFKIQRVLIFPSRSMASFSVSADFSLVWERSAVSPSRTDHPAGSLMGIFCGMDSLRYRCLLGFKPDNDLNAHICRRSGQSGGKRRVYCSSPRLATGIKITIKEQKRGNIVCYSTTRFCMAASPIDKVSLLPCLATPPVFLKNIQ